MERSDLPTTISGLSTSSLKVARERMASKATGQDEGNCSDNQRSSNEVAQNSVLYACSSAHEPFALCSAMASATGQTIAQWPPNAKLPMQNTVGGDNTPLALPKANNTNENAGTSTTCFTSPYFRNRMLRSGKWVEEEEEYARLLIEQFEKGYVLNCDKSVKLRFYLSQRLHCSPMRISKKFAGKQIGKMVYDARTPPLLASDEAERRALEVRVAAAEERFLKVAYYVADMVESTAAQFLFPQTSISKVNPMSASLLPLPTGIRPTVSFHQPMFPPMPMTLNASAPIMPIPLPSQLGNITFPFPSLFNRPVPAPTSIVTAGTPSIPIAVTSVQQVASQHTQLLHKAYLDALNQESLKRPVILSVPEKSEKSQGSTTDSSAAQTQQLVSISNQQHFEAIPSSLKGFGEVAAMNGQSLQQSIPCMPLKELSSSKPVTLSIGPPPVGKFDSQPFQQSGMNMSTLEQPRPQHHPIASADVSMPPPSTALVRATTGYDSVPSSQIEQPEKSPADHLFSAESYAIFAQESALAASQHAAYMTNIQHPHQAASSINMIRSFDADAVVKLVSEHVGLHNYNNLNHLQNHQQQHEQQSSPPNGNVGSIASRIQSVQSTMQSPPMMMNTEILSDRGLTPVERFYGSAKAILVSASEPSSNSSTDPDSSRSSCHGSTTASFSQNESNDGTTTDTTFSSNESEESGTDSMDNEGPLRKKHKGAVGEINIETV